jgi:hypothetical protein
MVKSDTCDTAQNKYIAEKIAMTNAQIAYARCVGTDPAYPTSSYNMALQPVIDPKTDRMRQVLPVVQNISNQASLYASLITSTKALIAATQPLTDYKTILQGQLNATLQQNASMEQQITTDAAITMANLAITPDLSKGGPFGTSNVQQGVLWGFLAFYSLFFILLSVVIYLKFKNSVSSSLLITGIIVMLAAAGVGAYFTAAYSLFLFDVQSLITTVTV